MTDTPVVHALPAPAHCGAVDLSCGKQGDAVSGLLRNFFAFIVGLTAYRRKAVADMTRATFWATPFDCGLRFMKSDKYLQLAETAQVDYLLQVGKFFEIVLSGTSFVNVAQRVQFTRPVTVFSRVRIDTRLLYADEKCAYFSHTVHCRGNRAAEVLVKMKFKRGRLTIAPSSFFPISFSAVPAQVLGLEPSLTAP